MSRTRPREVLKVLVGSRRLVKDCDWERLMRRGVQGVTAGVERRLLAGPKEEVGPGFKLQRVNNIIIIERQVCSITAPWGQNGQGL